MNTIEQLFSKNQVSVLRSMIDSGIAEEIVAEGLKNSILWESVIIQNNRVSNEISLNFASHERLCKYLTKGKFKFSFTATIIDDPSISQNITKSMSKLLQLQRPLYTFPN